MLYNHLITMLQALKYSAHVKWFVDESANKHQSLKLSEVVTVVILVLAGLVALKLIDNYMRQSGLNERIDSLAGPYTKLATPLIRFSTALLLVLNIINNNLLSPNISANDSEFSKLVFIVFGIIAVLLIIGYQTRLAAALLFITYLVIGVYVDPIGALDHIEYIGISSYLILAVADNWSLDNKLKTKKRIIDKYSQYSLPFYKISLGIGLAILAFSEKLLDPYLAKEFLANYHWNFLSIIGLTDHNFIIMVGIIELLIGLSLILNLATRLTILALLFVMTTTAILLGFGEVTGHLFAVGIVFAILVDQKQ